MPFELQRVKRRIQSTRQIRKVTTAMQQVASARLVGDRRVLASSRRYTERLTQVLRDVAGEVTDPRHPLLAARNRTGTVGLIVFGSARGLCGGFNSTLLDHLAQTARTLKPAATPLFVVGKVTHRRCRRAGYPIARFLAQPRRPVRGPALDDLTGDNCRRFVAGELDAVHMVFLRFFTPLRQDPTATQLLPAPFSLTDRDGPSVAAFEPAPERILNRLLPEFVRQSIDDAFLNSMASENAARQTAMSRASDNARDMLRDLTASYRRLRQESITTEMLELVGGGTMLE